MRYKLETIVDITQTDARREDGNLAYKQHQNFLTVMQTLTLRCNIEVIQQEVSKKSVEKLFGSNFKGTQKVWSIVFDLERPDSVTIDDMSQDLHLVPFINDLTETVKFKICAFHLQESADMNTKITSI